MINTRLSTPGCILDPDIFYCIPKVHLLLRLIVIFEKFIDDFPVLSWLSLALYVPQCLNPDLTQSFHLLVTVSDILNLLYQILPHHRRVDHSQYILVELEFRGW